MVVRWGVRRAFVELGDDDGEGASVAGEESKTAAKPSGLHGQPSIIARTRSAAGLETAQLDIVDAAALRSAVRRLVMYMDIYCMSSRYRP